MRTLLIIILALSSSTSISQNQKNNIIDIQNAIDSNFLKLEIEGFQGKSNYLSIDNDGFYFGKCITITFENTTDSTILINMPIGSLLKCRDTIVQDMIVTKSFTIYLSPKVKEGYLIYAMCGEIYDMGPTEGIFYDYGGFAEPEVIKIAQLIEEKNIQNNLGQYALWAVRNNADSAKLTHYGASNLDLQFIVENLKVLNLETKLTQQIKTIKIEQPKRLEVRAIDNNYEVEREYKISALTWFLSSVCGVLFLVVIILIKKKK